MFQEPGEKSIVLDEVEGDVGVDVEPEYRRSRVSDVREWMVSFNEYGGSWEEHVCACRETPQPEDLGGSWHGRGLTRVCV